MKIFPELAKLKRWWRYYHPPAPTFDCPVCGYLTLRGIGQFDICHVCFWEDDGLSRDYPDCDVGPNHGVTLREARANFAEFGACDVEAKRFTRPPSKEQEATRRVPFTLPAERRAGPSDGGSYFHALCGYNPEAP